MNWRHVVLVTCLLAMATACRAADPLSTTRGTAAPPAGWANAAPTRVEQVVDHGEHQLLEVSQGQLRTWVRVPQVEAKTGDYVLLGQGTLSRDVAIPEAGESIPELIEISHVRVVDFDTARQVVASASPADAVAIADVYAQIDQRAGREIVVFGAVVKATRAVGWNWVHLRDGTGEAGAGTHDLTIKTQASVTRGQRVAFQGVLRRDVDLGWGYHYDALVEDSVKLDGG